MIKVTIYLQNGKTISAYLKKRQYNYLVGEIPNLSFLKKAKKWIKKILGKGKGK